MHELPDLSRLSIAEKDALIFPQFKQIDRLTVMVPMLSARVIELEGRLHKDCHNSSKPPSSDGLAKKPKSLRQSGGRKPGERDNPLRARTQPKQRGRIKQSADPPHSYARAQEL